MFTGEFTGENGGLDSVEVIAEKNGDGFKIPLGKAASSVLRVA
jgi:hypothetical protein